MAMLDFFQWWYGSGWAGVLVSTRRRLKTLSQMFSAKILLRTLFSPWRRIMTYPGTGMGAHMRALGDNMVSRFVGFFTRLFVLLAAGCAFVVLALAGLVEFIVWPLLLPGAIVLIVAGLV